MQYTTQVSYVLPITDDGGSTSEIVRVLGGPAIGDIRSRCIRLAESSNREALAVKDILAHRLTNQNSQGANHEWDEILRGDHYLWKDVSEPYKHTIRAFLSHFSYLIGHSEGKFDLRNGSIGKAASTI